MASSGEPLYTVNGLASAQAVALDQTRGRNRAYVGGGNLLYVVELSGTVPHVLATIGMGVGEDVGIHSVAYNPNTDKIYVTGYRDNTVTIVNAETWGVARRLTGFAEPSFVTVNTTTNKVYVSNHTGGAPWGRVTVISDTSTLGQVYLSGDLYGIAADSVHNILYVASISAARVYAIDGGTDTTLGDIQIIRSLDHRPVPLRMTAVNPLVVTDTHLWLTSSSGDLWGMDRLILLSGNWPGNWPPPSDQLQPRATAVAQSPDSGLVFDPASWSVFASNTASNLVTVSRDNTTLCNTPLRTGADAQGLYVIVHDYRYP